MKQMKTRRAAVLAAAGSAMLLCAGAFPVEAAEGAFAGMTGYWSGGGTISVANGTSERIRCKAQYAVDGSGTNLNQSLRCASDSYKFEVSSNLANAGGTISGSWMETTRNAGGNVSGVSGDSSPGSSGTGSLGSIGG